MDRPPGSKLNHYVLIAASSCLPLVCLSGCRGVQSVLDPAGPQSGRIATLWWFLFFVCLVVFILVIGFLGYATSTSRRRVVQAESSPELPHPLAGTVSPPSEHWL